MGLAILGGLALAGMFGGKDKSPPPPPPTSSGTGTNIKAEQVKAASQATHDATMQQGDTLGQSQQNKARAAAAAQGTAYRDTSKEMGIV